MHAQRLTKSRDHGKQRSTHHPSPDAGDQRRFVGNRTQIKFGNPLDVVYAKDPGPTFSQRRLELTAVGQEIGLTLEIVRDKSEANHRCPVGNTKSYQQDICDTCPFFPEGLDMKDGGHWIWHPPGSAMGRRRQTTNSQLAIVMDMIAVQVTNTIDWRHLVIAQGCERTEMAAERTSVG